MKSWWKKDLGVFFMVEIGRPCRILFSTLSLLCMVNLGRNRSWRMEVLSENHPLCTCQGRQAAAALQIVALLKIHFSLMKLFVTQPMAHGEHQLRKLSNDWSKLCVNFSILLSFLLPVSWTQLSVLRSYFRTALGNESEQMSGTFFFFKEKYCEPFKSTSVIISRNTSVPLAID